MDLDVIANVLEHAVASLGLDARHMRRSRMLAAPCPRGPDVGADDDLEFRVLAAFLREDREAVARQIEDAFDHLLVVGDETAEAVVDDASVVHVQLGVPLIGRDRVLLRVCTRTTYGDDARTVTTDCHAWLDRAGTISHVLSKPQRELASAWPRWSVFSVASSPA